MKKIIMLILMMLVLTTFAYAHGETGHDDFSEALEIIENKVPCEDLTDDEFELLGDYYMELMHPGEAHITMDEMMGGEGSESLKIMHINMGKRFYCGSEAVANQGIMMGMMGSGGMNMIGTNMMGGSWWLWGIVGMLFWIALLVALVFLIIWLYKNITGKATKNNSALEILRKRFAKGEITKKQHNSMKKELK